MEEKHSVWVGSLSLNAKEDVLSLLFGKFGPVKSVVIAKDEQGKSKQFGYINYYNREVAECAAHGMDGYIILKQAIKTKGPRELEKLRSVGSETLGVHVCLEKKDYRMFTDCLFFIDGRDCTWKSGECPFRHCQRAKETNNVCEKWLQRQCEDSKCCNRHPRLTRNGTMLNESTIIRCPSHNAFKCFGECNNKDCNTHFLEHSAYVEHVKLGKKKTVHPFATCLKCQAVFFSSPEKLHHRCCKNISEPDRSGVQHFVSTRVQAEKDVVYPVASYLTTSLRRGVPHFPPSNEPRSLPSASVEDHSNRTKEQSFAACNTHTSSDIVPRNLETHTSSSSYVASRGAVVVPHAGPAMETAHTTFSSNVRKDPEPIGVFWDFENCQIPKGKSALAIVRKLRSAFFKERREVEFMCVCDISKEKKAVIEELNKAQVTVVHINSTSKNAADDKLRQSLRRFAQTYSTPATVILISGDVNFALELSDLHHRHKFHIICLHNAAASSALLGFAHESHRFDLFAEDLESFTSSKATRNPLLSNDVLITNLPTNKGVAFLKARLTQLSDNCGGKVLTVSGTKAIIRFANSDTAFRARRRLDKEELLGSILSATLLPVQANGKRSSASRLSEKAPEKEINHRTAPGAGVEGNFDASGSSSTKNVKPKEESKKQLHSGINNNFGHENSKILTNSPARAGFTYFARSPVLNHHFPSYPGNVMYNLFQPPAPHNVFQLPQVTTPPLHGVAPGIFTTPALSPVVNGVIRRSPSPDQQFSGIDLLVTNINETVSKKEVKKKLASIFREHSKVFSVVLHARTGAPLRAFVKVPKIMDANIAISKVNGKTIFGKIVHVFIASEKDKELCYLQDEVVLVLQDVPLNWLPLTEFLTNFEKKYGRSLDMRHLQQLRDVAVVNGSTGCQTISLLEGKIDTELLEVDTASFVFDVYKLLHHFEGVVRLASFPALYWLEFHKEIQLSSSGALLAELLSGLPNVKVDASEPSSRCIQWIKPTSAPCDASSLMRLSGELVEILQKDHAFEMTINNLQHSYLSTFNKPLDASTYGFRFLNDIFYALPAAVEVLKSAPEDCLSLTRQHRVTLFSKEMEELLTEYKDNTVLLSNFMASYVKHFGQKFKVASFGYSRLTDLINAISNIAEIDGIGDQRTVTLVHKKVEACTLQRLLDNLTEELTVLLNASAGNEIPLNAVMDTYREQHDRHLSLASYGCETLEKLLNQLSNHFRVVHTGDGKLLQFYTSRPEEKVKADLTVLLQDQESRFIYVRGIPKAYERRFRRKLPYVDMPQLNGIIQSLSKELGMTILGNGNDQIIRFGSNAETPEVDFEFLFVKTAVDILYEHPDYVLPKLKFLSLYRQKLQQFESIDQDRKLIDCPPCCVQLRKRGKEDVASLKQDYCIQILIEQLKELLSSSPDTSFLLRDMSTLYQKHFGVKLNLNLYGVDDILELRQRLQGFIEMTSSYDTNRHDRLVLSPISRFQMETQSLLDGCAGCISLNRFAPAYQQLFSKACVVAEFGYSKLASLLNAVPHVAKIIGNGAEKVVIAVEMSIPERVCTDLLSLRIINEDSGDAAACLSKEGEVASPSHDPIQHSIVPKHHTNIAKDLPGNLQLQNDASMNCGPKKCEVTHEAALPAETIRKELELSSISVVHNSDGSRCDELSEYNKEQKRCFSGQVCTVETPVSCKSLTAHSGFDSKQSNVNQMVKKDSKVSPERNASSTSTSTARSTPQKVRLAANFMFSR